MFYLSMTPSFPIFRKFPFTKSTQRPLVLENELTEHAYFSNNPQHYFLLKLCKGKFYLIDEYSECKNIYHKSLCFSKGSSRLAS